MCQPGVLGHVGDLGAAGNDGHAPVPVVVRMAQVSAVGEHDPKHVAGSLQGVISHGRCSYKYK